MVPAAFTTMRLSRNIVLLLTTCALVATGSAQVVVYNFNDQSNATAVLTASSVATNVGASLFSVSDSAFTSTNYTTGSPPDTPAISDSNWQGTTATKYYSFTITPTAGYSITLTSLTFDYRNSGTGPASFEITAGGSSVGTGSLTNDTTWRSLNQSITMSSITSASEIRIYGYNGSGSSGTFAIDRVTLNGTVTAVPEPSTYAAILGGVALLGVIAIRRRKQAVAA
jgi:hypothetical protein